MPPRWWSAPVYVPSPGRLAPAFSRFFRRFVAPLVRLSHRPTLTGEENLPSDRPYLLVTNHSGAVGQADAVCLITCWLEKFGDVRPLAAMTHSFGHHAWPVKPFIRAIGAIPTTREAVLATLAAGVPVLVMPGGDHEVTRPLWQANRVDFAGRRGFLRLAREARVPIVPMGIRGTHLTAPVLWRSRLLLPYLTPVPLLLGIRRYPMTLLGALGVLAILLLGARLAWPLQALLVWAWLSSQLPLLAWVPWPVRIRIGGPISPEELFTDSDTDLTQALARVQAAVQGCVDRATASTRPRG